MLLLYNIDQVLDQVKFKIGLKVRSGEKQRAWGRGHREFGRGNVEGGK